VVAAASANGFKVIIDHHGNEAGTDCDGNGVQQLNGLWFDTGPGSDGTNGCIPGTVTAQTFQDN
jgi:endoglucanase